MTLDTARNGAVLTCLMTSLFAGILFVTEQCVTGRANYALWAMICLMNASIFLYNGIKLKRTSSAIAGVILGLFTVFSTVRFAFNIIGNKV